MKKKVGIGILSVLVVALVCAFAIVSVRAIGKRGDEEVASVDADLVRQEMLEVLESREGEYDPRSVVLRNTSGDVARDIAERLGAEVRLAGN